MKKSSHWYDVTGKACHTVPNKSKPGESRATSLTDARKLGLLPSVTTILDLLDKPQLTDWKLEQLTAEFRRRLTCIFPESQARHDSDVRVAVADMIATAPDVFHEQLCERAFQQVEDAADAGKLIHAAAELVLSGRDYDADELVFLPELKDRFPMRTFIDPIRAFVKEHDIHPTGHEVKVVNLAHGYAGTGDLPMTCRKGIGFGDWKTRKTKPGKPVRAYDGQLLQIGAYHGGHYSIVPRPGDFIAGFNLFISTTEPGRVEGVWYDSTEVATAYEAFTHMAALWRFLKGYDPRSFKSKALIESEAASLDIGHRSLADGASYANRPY